MGCCANAIFVVRSTIDYFVHRGSSVYAAALDVSKAYDSVNHRKLFSAIRDAGVPTWVILMQCLITGTAKCLLLCDGVIVTHIILEPAVVCDRVVRSLLHSSMSL